jgi:hypothetical protein
VGQFLTFSILLVVIIGLVLHIHLELPDALNWLGHLPGDLILKKNGAIVYLPFSTSVLISSVLTLLSQFFRKN